MSSATLDNGWKRKMLNSSKPKHGCTYSVISRESGKPNFSNNALGGKRGVKGVLSDMGSRPPDTWDGTSALRAWSSDANHDCQHRKKLRKGNNDTSRTMLWYNTARAEMWRILGKRSDWESTSCPKSPSSISVSCWESCPCLLEVCKWFKRVLHNH